MTKLIYLDTCTSDYFQGFSGLHVYAVPLDRGDTYRDVFDSLKELIAHEEIYGFEDNYAKIENECEGMRFKAKEEGYIDKVFNEYLEDYQEDCDTCYAYFGVKEE